MRAHSVRVGAIRKQDIDGSTLELLNSGQIQSATHIEEMAIDMGVLFALAFPETRIDAAAINCESFISRMRLCGSLVKNHRAGQSLEPEHCWISDTIRGWCAMAVASGERPSRMPELIQGLRPHFVDHHFAVREWAWLSLRPLVVADPALAVQSLEHLIADEDPRARRFAVEATRPRSVWRSHVALFKSEPEVAERLLSPLMCERDRYVQDSVANWINDASKTGPRWATDFVSEALDICECDDSLRIAKRGLRSIQNGNVLT